VGGAHFFLRRWRQRDDAGVGDGAEMRGGLARRAEPGCELGGDGEFVLARPAPGEVERIFKTVGGAQNLPQRRRIIGERRRRRRQPGLDKAFDDVDAL